MRSKEALTDDLKMHDNLIILFFIETCNYGVY